MDQHFSDWRAGRSEEAFWWLRGSIVSVEILDTFYCTKVRLEHEPNLRTIDAFAPQSEPESLDSSDALDVVLK